MVEARDYSGRGSALLLVERRRSPASAPIIARLSSRSSTGCAGADVRVRFLRARCSVALADEGAEHHFGHLVRGFSWARAVAIGVIRHLNRLRPTDCPVPSSESSNGSRVAF